MLNLNLRLMRKKYLNALFRVTSIHIMLLIHTSQVCLDLVNFFISLCCNLKFIVIELA